MLQAGLVSKGKVKQQKQNSRKNRRRTSGESSTDEAVRQAEAAQRTSRERDRKLNLEREQARQRKALRVQIRQLLHSNRVNDKRAEDRYNFTIGDKLKSIYVTSKQRRQLRSAQLVIVLFEDSQYLLPIELVEKVRALQPDVPIYTASAGSAGSERSDQPDADDPYANFQVPDDLMW